MNSKAVIRQFLINNSSINTATGGRVFVDEIPQSVLTTWTNPDNVSTSVVVSGSFQSEGTPFENGQVSISIFAATQATALGVYDLMVSAGASLKRYDASGGVGSLIYFEKFATPDWSRDNDNQWGYLLAQFSVTAMP